QVIHVANVNKGGPLQVDQLLNQLTDAREFRWVAEIQLGRAYHAFHGLFYRGNDDVVLLETGFQLRIVGVGDDGQDVGHGDVRVPVVSTAGQELLVGGVPVTGGRTAHRGQRTVARANIEDVA